MVVEVLFLIQLVILQYLQVESHTLYRSSTRFTYDPDIRDPFGVFNWQYTFQNTCGGLEQSPVNIQTDRLRYRLDFRCPRVSYSNRILRGELKNNGHSATFEPSSGIPVQLTNVPNRPGIFILHDFHFHYGGTQSRRMFRRQVPSLGGDHGMTPGSEHIVDGFRYSGEVHFVFYNSKYGDLEEAEYEADGLVVMSFLVQMVDDYKIRSRSSFKFSRFINRNIPRVASVNQTITTAVDLGIFLDHSCQFYTYYGSTTTPKCFQTVQWVIFRDPIVVTERAWNQLTKLDSIGDFDRLYGNYRNPQALNGRIIEANFRSHYYITAKRSKIRHSYLPKQAMGLQLPLLSSLPQLPNLSTGIVQSSKSREVPGHKFPYKNGRLYPGKLLGKSFLKWKVGFQ